MAELQFDDKNVAFENRENALVFAVMKTGKPYKPFALQSERDKNGKETGWYTVPKSLVFAYRSERLADGSRMSINRTKPVTRDERQKLLDAGIAKGLKVRPLEPEKEQRERPAPLTLETLMGEAVKL
jgi:hypothetical protein